MRDGAARAMEGKKMLSEIVWDLHDLLMRSPGEGSAVDKEDTVKVYLDLKALEARSTDGAALAAKLREARLAIDGNDLIVQIHAPTLNEVIAALESLHSKSAEKAVAEAESWEDSDGHLFLTDVKLNIGDRTVCLRCYKVFEDCYEGKPCESQKDGKWTDIGIEAILTSLKEGDDREIVRIPGDAAEIIEQLRAKILSEASPKESA